MIRITSSDKIICLTSNDKLFKPVAGSVLLAVINEKEIAEAYKAFMSSKEVREIYFYNKSADFLLKAFKSMFKIVEAAGGLVKNQDGEWLFIFRNGKWDLPKGKIEKNEKIRRAAIREVEEECGISGLTITGELETTYHTYTMNEQQILKPTYWFEMSCSGTSPLKPQTEEGITDVRWLKSSELKMVRENTFPSIRWLIEGISSY